MATNEQSDYFWEWDRIYPKGAIDVVANGDDEIRQIKGNVIDSLPGITGIVTSTHTELNLLDGKTTFGTSYTYDAGAAIGDVLLVVDVGGSAGLPAIDGSNLTDLTLTNFPNVTSTVTSDHTELNLLDGKTTFGTSYTYDVGTSIGDLFVLVDVAGGPAIPAVDGSLITNINTVNTPLDEIDIMSLQNSHTRLHYAQNA